jgi:myo-inositol-1(or 4)-monophosphatase
MSDELFSAVRGQGCTVNGQPATVSPTTELSEVTVALDWGRRQSTRQQSIESFLQFAHQVRTVRSFGSSALALAWVAAGRLDAYLNFQLSAWDIAAGALLIQEAGGQITTVANAPLPLALSTSCFGSNGYIHAPMLSLVRAHGD